MDNFGGRRSLTVLKENHPRFLLSKFVKLVSGDVKCRYLKIGGHAGHNFSSLNLVVIFEGRQDFQT
jgi:hypothetical protein